jgi:fibronectin-binding autotransporter adhesin
MTHNTRGLLKLILACALLTGFVFHVDGQDFDAGGVTVSDGSISGAAALTMAGGGIFTVTGANTYTGGTVVSSGTLMIGDGFTGAATITVGNGALANGGSSVGGFIFDGSNPVVTDIGTTYNLIDLTEVGGISDGTLTVNGEIFTPSDDLVVLDSTAGDSLIQLSVVPEPSTWMMVMGGVALLAWLRRVKRANS